MVEQRMRRWGEKGLGRSARGKQTRHAGVGLHLFDAYGSPGMNIESEEEIAIFRNCYGWFSR